MAFLPAVTAVAEAGSPAALAMHLVVGNQGIRREGPEQEEQQQPVVVGVGDLVESVGGVFLLEAFRAFNSNGDDDDDGESGLYTQAISLIKASGRPLTIGFRRRTLPSPPHA